MSDRIAVFVCECGTNIASVVDTSAVASHAGTLDGVVISEVGRWICAVDYLEDLSKIIRENEIERVVVACCTPRTHENIFRKALEEADLNPNLLEFVSIREQCSWVHKSEPEAATEKAKDLVEMAVAKARLLAPAKPMRIPVGDKCMVVGGGLAGMTAASTLADAGFKVVLVERSDKLGGALNRVSKLAPQDRSAAEVLEPLLKKVENIELIEIRINTEVNSVSGYIGNFKVELSSGEDRNSYDIATIIMATGMQEIEPSGLCGYGTSPNVVTELAFEEALAQYEKDGTGPLKKVSSVAVINCVGSRNEKRGCCNIGCTTAMKSIKTFKELKPEGNAYLFYRDLILPGTESVYLDEKRKEIDAMIQYSAEDIPEVTQDKKGKLKVSAHDGFLEEDVSVDADLVVLVSAFKGDDSAENFKELLRIAVGSDNFYREAHVKLKPIDFATDGIYLAGCARSPKTARETAEEAMGAALRAAIPMKRGYIESDGLVAEIDLDNCIGCGLCRESCAYGAPEAVAFTGNQNEVSIKPKFSIIEALCKGCGTCAAGCPEHAITMRNFTDEQLEAQVETAAASPVEIALAFCCHWCALGAADIAGVSRLSYPTDIRIIRVMCSGRIDPAIIMNAFAKGVPGLMVAGCEIPTCHYITGNIYAQYRLKFVKELMAEIGLEPERLRGEWLSAAQGDRFARVMKEFNSDIDSLGPLSQDILSGLDLKAACATAGSERMRLLVGKLPELEKEGNRYGERFSEHELDSILKEALQDELILQKILFLLNGKGMSIRQISIKLSLPMPVVFRKVLALNRDKLIKRSKVKGIAPIYTTVKAKPKEQETKVKKTESGGVSGA